MFSGIITDIGTIETFDRKGDDITLTVKNNLPLSACGLGASIAHSGVCLTVIESQTGLFKVEVSGETVAKTNLGSWNVGTRINLESSLKIGDELSGHLVFGHVDTLVEVTSIEPDGESWRLQFRIPEEYKKYIASKGSVTLDGISLTVNEVENDIFGVCIIPHTWTHTTLSDRKVGDKINMEVDMLARYVARMLNLEGK